MTRFVRISFASLSIVLSFALGLAACGGGDDAVTIVDAATDAAIDAPTDAPPLVCNAPTMNCGGTCVNTTNSEMACGNCTTMCTAGQICTASACACPTMSIPTNISGGIGINLMGAQLNTNTLSGDALVIGIDFAQTAINTNYPMSGTTLGDLPTVGYAINLQLSQQSQTVDASFAATEGTLRFTTICADTSGGLPNIPNGGVAGTITNVKFSAVDGLLSGNPTLVPNGCTIPATGTIASISFSIGDTVCSPTAQ